MKNKLKELAPQMYYEILEANDKLNNKYDLTNFTMWNLFQFYRNNIGDASKYIEFVKDEVRW